MQINDEVVYDLKHWQVIRIVPQVQTVNGPHVPDRLRLWRPDTGECIWAPRDKVIPA